MPEHLSKFIVGADIVDSRTITGARRGGIAVKLKYLILAANESQARRRALRIAESGEGLLGFAYGSDFKVRTANLATERNRNFIKKWEIVLSNKTWDRLEELGRLDEFDS